MLPLPLRILGALPETQDNSLPAIGGPAAKLCPRVFFRCQFLSQHLSPRAVGPDHTGSAGLPVQVLAAVEIIAALGVADQRKRIGGS